MNRHLLVAVDGSPNSKKALDYVADIYRDVEDLDVSLITVAESLPSFLTQGASTFNVEKNRLKKLEDLVIKQERECESILEKARSILIRAGLKKETIHCKPVARGMGPVKSILLEARYGLYDALVIGRRGLGRLVAYFMGSVTTGVLQQIKDVPVWIVDEPQNSKNVLIAVDACDPCLKVVDHAGYALAGLKEVKITVLHVLPKFRPFIGGEALAKMEDIEELVEAHSESKFKEMLGNVRDIFAEAGLDSAGVRIKIKKGGAGAAHEIMGEYEKGGYGTLVVGRRGVGGWEAVFPGSVSSKLLSSFSKGAIWVVT